MSKSKSIKLHKEHGLNPTLSVCIICGKDTEEIVLLGAAYKGKAPMHMVTSVEPCKECREKYLSKGVLLVETLEESRVPTGRVMVVTKEGFSILFNVEVPRSSIAYIQLGLLEKIGMV